MNFNTEMRQLKSLKLMKHDKYSVTNAVILRSLLFEIISDNKKSARLRI